jgi:hypothetical protein
LPDAVRGSVSTNTMSFGSLNGAIFVLTSLVISAVSASDRS